MTRARDLSNDEANNGGATPPFVAGKNRLINGDFSVWQRGTSFSTASSLLYTADRWWTNAFSGTATVSQQTFTPGTAPVAGYEGQYFLRFASTNTFTQLGQRIEDVRTFAGQTVSVSFWAKAASSLSLQPYLEQNFGSGGSSSTFAAGTAASVTTSWQRFTATIPAASISGKTIGTSSFLNFYFLTSTLSTNIDIWGVQIESGSVATSFTPAGGGFLGAELALCQRYYWRAKVASGFGTLSNYWFPNTTSLAYAEVSIPVPLRALPSAVEWGGNIGVSDGFNLIGGISSITVAGTTPFTTYVALTTNMSSASLTVYRGYKFADQGAGTAFLAISAEL